MNYFIKNTKTFLKIKYKDDFGLLWLLSQAVLAVTAFIIRANSSMGLALFIGGMLLSAYFVSVFHERKGVDIILGGDCAYLKIKYKLMVSAALIENLLFGILIFIYIYFSVENINILSFLYTIILYLFVTAIGLLIGICCKNQKIAIMICSILIIVNFLKIIILEENLRYFSPVIQIANMNRFQWWNLFMLFLIAIISLLFILIQRKGIIFLGVILALSIVLFDVNYSESRYTLSDEYQVFSQNILNRVNERNRECGFSSYENIEVYKSIYYPWEPASEKMIIYVEQKTLYMNCFTESLCNMKEKEIVARAVYSLLDPDSVQQRAIAELYIESLLGNSEYVNSFLYENQIRTHGDIVSKNYGLFAEVLVNQPENLSKLYEFTKEYHSNEELLEAWGVEVN